MQLYFLIFGSIVASVVGVELPAYIKRCYIHDPNINQCIENNGNLAIPEFVKGIKILGIPVLSPVRLPIIRLYSRNFRLLLTDVKFDNFKDFTLHNVNFDLQNNLASLDFRAEYLNFTSRYFIEQGEVLTRTISGKGKFHMSLIDNVMAFSAKLSQYTKGGEVYLAVPHAQIKLVTQRAAYYFENVSSPQGGDINQFLKQNWAHLKKKTLPGVEQFLLNYILLVSRTMVGKVPLKDLFI